MALFDCRNCRARAQYSQAFSSTWDLDGRPKFSAILQCANCSGFSFMDGFIDRSQNDVKVVFPPSRDEDPADYPEGVRRNYRDAVRSFDAGIAAGCVMMLRGALQAAMREQNAKGANLKQEIEDLASRHVIPRILSEWADAIRDGGNLVAHPEPGKQVEMKDAEELLALADSIFEYLYVVPADVARRRARLNPASASGGAAPGP